MPLQRRSSIRELYPVPKPPSGRAIAIVLFCWFAYFFGEAVILEVQHDQGWLDSFKHEGFTYVLLGIYAIPVWYLARYRLQNVGWPLRVIALAFASLIYASIWLVTYIWLYPHLFGEHALYRSDLGRYWLFLIQDAIRLFIIVVAITYTWLYHQTLRRRERREAEILAHQRQVELSVLKSQLNPHFLFNTLNAVNALVGSEPERARKVQAMLGQTLRYSLETDDAELVPLAKELEFTHTYLAIEKVRFGDRLRTHFQIDPSAKRCLVPPMILQPLAENAVRHGVAPFETGGDLHVQAKLNGETLQIQVEDSGPGPGSASFGELLAKGRGLHHTHLRLQKLFGESCGLELSNSKGFRITFAIPAKIAGDVTQTEPLSSIRTPTSSLKQPLQETPS